MKTVTPEVSERINNVFAGLFELDEKLDAYKDEMKLIRDSAKDIVNTLADDLEVSKKAVTRAYKEYVFTVQNPEIASDSFNIQEAIKK